MPRFVNSALLLLLFASISCKSGSPARPPDVGIFDGIVNQELFSSGFRQRVPLTFEKSPQDGFRVYQSDYVFPSARPGEYYTCVVRVGKAGSMILPGDFQKRYAETQAKYADRGPEYLRHEFPDIGRRAQREAIAGPGGASSGLTFTTSDGAFDVSVSLSLQLPRGVEDPAWDIDATARRISERYDKLSGSQQR